MVLTKHACWPQALRSLHGAWLAGSSHLSLEIAARQYDSLRIAVGLHLGTLLCGPHPCRLCGEEVDVMDKHGLSLAAGGVKGDITCMLL